MKGLNRALNLKEKIILLLMIIFLIGLMYYYFVDKPVRKGIAEAEEEVELLDTVNAGLETKLSMLEEIQAEMDSMENSDEGLSYVQSYNYGDEEMNYLHTILDDTLSYNISFADVTRDSNLIRRNVSISYSTDSYDKAEEVIRLLSKSDTRSLVEDVRLSRSYYYNSYYNDSTLHYVNGIPYYADGTPYYTEEYSVSCVVIFYETMADGTEDAGLPVEEETTEVSEE